jgi:hypothetical protein
MVERQSYKTMVAALTGQVEQVFPWDLLDELAVDETPMLLDIRCPHEFDAAHIAGSVNVPGGIFEIAADYGSEETVPELVEARERPTSYSLLSAIADVPRGWVNQWRMMLMA